MFEATNQLHYITIEVFNAIIRRFNRTDARIDELEKQVALLTNRVDYLYKEP